MGPFVGTCPRVAPIHHSLPCDPRLHTRSHPSSRRLQDLHCLSQITITTAHLLTDSAAASGAIIALKSLCAGSAISRPSVDSRGCSSSGFRPSLCHRISQIAFRLQNGSNPDCSDDIVAIAVACTAATMR